MTANTLRQRLAERRGAGGLISAPGVYDMISLRLADRLGFDALYMTGYGTVASHLGLPDAGLATYSDMVGRVERMAQGARTPLVADADTGYGGPLNVEYTVRGYERAGAAAIQIEDQEWPKRCGHTLNRRVIAAEDMVQKVRVAVQSRASRDFLVIARTDARTSLGLDEALRRGELYARAGADLLFVESPESEQELARIAAAFAGGPWLVANMVEGGRTPVLGAGDLAGLGFALAIHPVTALLAAAAALERVYGSLKEHGSSGQVADRLLTFEAMNELMGFEELWRRDRELGAELPRPSGVPDRAEAGR